MNKNLKLILLALLFVALLAAAVVLYNNLGDDLSPDQLATEPTGDTGETESAQRSAAPDITVTDNDGNERKLSEFIGKPIILNFWASWCSPCKSEMPDFEEAYLEYGSQIHFLMVNCTTSSRETLDSAKEFIADSGYTFPVYYDTTGEASTAYSAYSIPMTWFIDAEGNLTAYAQGAIDGDVLKQGIAMISTPDAE